MTTKHTVDNEMSGEVNRVVEEKEQGESSLHENIVENVAAREQVANDHGTRENNEEHIKRHRIERKLSLLVPRLDR